MTDPQQHDQQDSHPAPAPPELSGHQAPAGPHHPYGYPMPPFRQTEPLAIVALVLAVMGPATCAVSAVAGAIIGQMALRKIRENPDALDGKGLAKAGMIVGWVMTGLTVLFILAYVGFIIFAIVAGVNAD